jgi:drug/metabolite transporter (DMT)-like permease
MFQKDFSFVHKYFIAEKQESLLFLIVGIIAVVLAVVFFFFLKSNPAFFKGAAIPLFVVGLLLGVVGYTVYARSEQQKKDVAYEMGINPHYVQGSELPRMKTVMRNFVIYRYTEIVLAMIGIALFFYFRSNPSRSFYTGLGLTLAIMALIALGADYFAEKRGAVYTKELEKFAQAK